LHANRTIATNISGTFTIDILTNASKLVYIGTWEAKVIPNLDIGAETKWRISARTIRIKALLRSALKCCWITRA
jgi:hypothetical protein